MSKTTEHQGDRERSKAPSSGISRVASDPVSRRKFMALTGASAAAAAFLAACGDDDNGMTTTGAASGGEAAIQEFGKGDVGILNYALTLEYLEAAFYADVIRSGLFKGSDLATIRKFGQTEDEHVGALKGFVKSAGAKPAPKPKTEFPLDDAKSVLALAATVENVGAAAYLGQAPNIKSASVLAAALSIHSVEGRHAAALDTLQGKTITPDGPFAKPQDAATVLKSVEPFIVG